MPRVERTPSLLVVTLLAGLTATALAAGTRDHAFRLKVDAEIRRFQRTNQLAGCTVAIVKGGRLLFSRGFGLANPASGLPAGRTVPYLTASVSKTVVAVAAMRLVEQGRLDLDADINRYLPFPVANPRFPGVPITARELLRHTSSILEPPAEVTARSYRVGRDPVVSLEDFCRSCLSVSGANFDVRTFSPSRPGNAYAYSNLGTALLGFVLERASGVPFDEWTRREIFTPLGMRHSGWRLESFSPNYLAMPTASDGKLYGHYTFPDYPSGSLRASAQDLSCFLRMVIQGGRWHGRRLLTEQSLRAMLTFLPLDPTAGPGSGEGLLWQRRKFGADGPVLYGHAGAERGVFTAMFFEPRSRVGVILLTNRDPDARLGTTGEALLNRLVRLGR